MEYKTVILSVFIMSLVFAQIQVEADRVCCPTWQARHVFNVCRYPALVSIGTCLDLSGCKSLPGPCPPEYSNDILKSSGDVIKEYCNLGCVTSVCGALTTLQNSDVSETVNEAVEKCTKACATLCTKGSITTVETA